MSKIISLKSSNFMGLKAVEIYPDGSMVQICGKNGSGKSSVLNSITAALGGVDKAAMRKPVRDGQDKAEIILETEDLIVTRRFTAAGGTSLIVKSKDGATFSAGQSKVDALLGKLSLDPFAFTQLDPKKQRAQLLELVDLPFDPAALEAERKALFDERAATGRDSKAIGDASVDDSLPLEEPSAGEIIAAIRAGEASNALIAKAKHSVEHWTAEVADFKESLARAERKLAGAQEHLAAAPTYVDTSGLEVQLGDVEELGAAIRANNAAIQQAKRKANLREKYNDLTAKLEAIEKKKVDGLAQTVFPVEGLGFDADGVTFDGIPFTQVNSGIQLETSMALAAALNPGLRVLRIAEGSLLDADALKRVAAFAEQRDFQVWLEIVGDGDGTGIVIEDGEVA